MDETERDAHEAEIAREAQIEREQIEAVFCLGGGELADEPWAGFRHWYDGEPEYAQSKDYDREYRTAVVCELFGQVATPEGWERVNAYLSSGERECPARECEDLGDTRCPLCDEQITDGTHPDDGYVYLGEGYQEVVFRRLSDESEES